MYSRKDSREIPFFPLFYAYSVLEIQCAFYAHGSDQHHFKLSIVRWAGGYHGQRHAPCCAQPSRIFSALHTLAGVKGRSGLSESQAVSYLVSLISSVKTHPFSRLAMFRNPVSVIIPSFK